MTSLEERSAALARAVHATTACSRASVLLFGDLRPHLTSAPAGGCSLREDARALRRLFFPALSGFAAGGAYYVPSGARHALPGLNAESAADLLVVPLQTGDDAIGALIVEVEGQPNDETIAELRSFADVAAWMIAPGRVVSPADREARQSALLSLINERARKALDRQAIVESIAGDVRHAFGAARCVFFTRDGADPATVRLVAIAQAPACKSTVPASAPLGGTWIERVLGGSVVARDEVSEDEVRDTLLCSAGARSALMVPLVIDGRVEHALALHFERPLAFDEIDIVMLQAVASHLGLALANVQLYDLERLRRARAESLERVVRMLRDTQTIEEVLLVFAVTVSHEVKLTCATYELDAAAATRRAFRAVESAHGGAAPSVETRTLLPLLDREDVVPAKVLDGELRAQLFGESEGVVTSLRVDGNLWGFAVFAAVPGVFDWDDPERRVYFHMLSSHLELALAGALGFERIQQLARALSESNEFKDDLLAMLAHDFKGPLTVISGYVEILMESAPETVRDELETIHAQTRRLVRLSDDAVALAQTQAGEFSLERAITDLRAVVSESVKAHARGEERFRLAGTEQPIPVWLDAARFTYVLDNLLMNALKYSRDQIVVRLGRSESNATLDIVDRGIGIPASEIGAVFARFGRASNAMRKGISGSGVGLYVSRKIVEAHGGSIAVQSKEDEGSTFTVTLPLAAEQEKYGIPEVV